MSSPEGSQARQEQSRPAAPQVTPVRLRPDRVNVLAGIVMFLITLIFTGYNIQWFFWVPLLPLLFIVWILRVRTTVDTTGISAIYLFRPRKTLDWKNFRGLRFNRGGKAFAASHDDKQFWLPGVTFNSLITLNEATQGLIPDPLTPAQEEADQKVQVINKDGHAVLMDSDEYAEYQKQRRAEYEATHGPIDPEDDVDNNSTTA